MATFEKTGASSGKLTMEIPPEIFARALADTYKREVSRYNIPGFRKGHAPRPVIERMYGKNAFYEGAFESLWKDIYDAAVVEHALTVVDEPALDITSISETDGIVFTAEVTTKPELTLGQYKDLEIKKQDNTVSDADVDAALEAEREKLSHFEPADRYVQNGDKISLDYAGEIDGEYFDGGTGAEQELTIGSNSFIPGFEEQLIGAALGESRDIKVTFPTEYHAEELAGKDATFHCMIRAITEKHVPDLDDEFIKDISEFDTVEAWKADCRAALQKAADERACEAQDNAAIEQACANATAEIPDCMVEREIDVILREAEARIRRRVGIDPAIYYKIVGTTPEKLRESYREDAQERVKLELMFEAIAKAEGVVAEEDEIDAAIAEFAEKTNLSADKIRFDNKYRDYFADGIVTKKAIKLITDSARLVEQ